jgi:AcrR family transcriptional regulator
LVASKINKAVMTCTSLRDALLTESRQVGWNDITIQTICDRADVARSSFYAHYANRTALLDDVFAVVTEDLHQTIFNQPPRPGELVTIRWLVDHIGAQPEQFFANAGTKAGRTINARFHQTAGSLLGEELQRKQTQMTPDAIAFCIGGAFASIEHDMQQRQNGGPDRTMGSICALIRTVIEPRSKWDQSRRRGLLACKRRDSHL